MLTVFSWRRYIAERYCFCTGTVFGFKEIFFVAATPYPSLHIISFFITNETVTNVQFLAPTRKSTYLSMETLPLFMVSFKRSNTFYETWFLSCPEKKFHNFKILEINYKTVIEKLDYVCNKLPKIS